MITPFSSVFKIGIPLSIILFIQFYFATNHTIDTQEILPTYVSYIQIGTVMLGVFLSCTDHKKKFENKVMKYSEAIGCGVLTVAFAAIMFSLFIFFYLYFNPEVGKSLEEISRKHVTQEIPKDVFKLSPLNKSILAAVQSFIQTFMIGFISSILIGFFVQKRTA